MNRLDLRTSDESREDWEVSGSSGQRWRVSRVSRSALRPRRWFGVRGPPVVDPVKTRGKLGHWVYRRTPDGTLSTSYL